MTQPTSTRAGLAAALGTIAIWTAFVLISRLGGQSPLTAFDILALRLSTAALLLTLFAERLSRRHFADFRLWTLALLGGVGYGVLVYSGLKQAPAAHGAVLLSGLQPFLVALIAWWLAGEKPGPLRVAGYAAIALGIGLVAVPLLSGHGDTLIGDALLIGASAVWALFSVLARRWAFAPWLLTRFIAIASALVFLPVYALFLPKGLAATPPGMLALQALYQGVGPTIVAMILFLKAVESLGAPRVGALVAMVPVLSGLGAVWLLGEPLTVWLVSGLAAVSLGAFLAARPQAPALRTAKA